MPYLYLIAAALVWGGSFAVGKVLVGQADPFVVAWVRFAIASAAFAAIEAVAALARRRRVGEPSPPASAPGRAPSARDYALLGLSGIFGYNAFFFYGLTLTTATESSLICASAPIMLAVIGLVFLGERMSLRKAGGIILSVAGVALVILGAASTAAGSAAQGGAAGPAGLSAGRLLGDLMQVASVLCWAVYSVIGKRVLERVSPLAATARATYWGAAFFTAAVLVRLGPSGLEQAVSLLGTRQLPGLLYLALVCTVFGFLSWYLGLRAVEVSRASVYLNLIPVSTLVIAALTLGERLTLVQLGGGLLVVAGVTLVSAVSQTAARPAGATGKEMPTP